ncbi:MAG: hypothetical protein WC468_00425 [Candidatus Paceibacterota bacterium]
MELIDQIKPILESDDDGIKIDASLFKEIMSSEDALRHIKMMPEGLYRLYLKSKDVETNYFQALSLADSFDDYRPFLSHERHYGSWELKGAMLYAKTGEQFHLIAYKAEDANKKHLLMRCFEKWPDACQSVEECAGILSSFFLFKHFSIDGCFKKKICKRAVGRGVALAKELPDVSKLYKSKHEDCPEDFYWFLASELVDSPINFGRKDLLKKQVNLCRNCGRMDEKSFSALKSLLMSVLEFGQYQMMSGPP